MRVDGQRHTPAASPPGRIRCPLYRRLGGPQSRSGRVRKISPPPGFDPRTVQPVASRCADWAIRPRTYKTSPLTAFKLPSFPLPTLLENYFDSGLAWGPRGHSWLTGVSAKVSQDAGSTRPHYISAAASAPSPTHLLPHAVSTCAETAPTEGAALILAAFSDWPASLAKVCCRTGLRPLFEIWLCWWLWISRRKISIRCD
jgi:hypothetical protein